MCQFPPLGHNALLPAPPSALATSIVVDTTADDNLGGHCTLRQAILAANTDTGVATCAAGSGADTITFSITGTIVLSYTLGALTITNTVTINGPGASLLTISGNNATRVISITSGITTTLSKLTIANGSASGSDGGGVYNSGTLLIANSTFSSNAAANVGGGIHNGGTLSITNSTFSSNFAGTGGGAINNAGSVNLTNSTFSGNFAINGGGGIWNQNVLFITNTTFYNNNVQNNVGGGIFDLGYLDVTNSTFSDNIAPPGNGGGIYKLAGPPTIVRDTIFVNNTGGNCVGSVIDGGHNVRWPPPDGSCVGTIGDPNLGPLANNGGATQTMALLAGSFAIDAGLNSDCPSTDQRGYPRPVDGDSNGTATCDAGAYEKQFTLFLPLIKK